jgi:hypothetical protein
VTVHVPDIAAMSDDELAIFARGFDGRWSEQTRGLMQRFGTDKLDLNRAWASSWIGWTCPCCGREKRDIARLTRNGVLLCRLERHHDHGRDVARKLFDTATGAAHAQGPAAGQIGDAKDALTVLVERFEAVLICGDCNAAEGEAKRLLAGTIDPDFTFGPAEIGMFITARPNQKHEVDLERAHTLWFECKPDFEDRLTFTRQLAARFAQGRNRRDTTHRRGSFEFNDRDYVWNYITDLQPEFRSHPIARALEAR